MNIPYRQNRTINLKMVDILFVDKVRRSSPMNYFLLVLWFKITNILNLFSELTTGAEYLVLRPISHKTKVMHHKLTFFRQPSCIFRMGNNVSLPQN